MRRFLSAFLVICMLCALITPIQAEAKSTKKSIKKITLSIGKSNVTKSTYIVKKGTSVKLKAKVFPAKAKKSVSFKSSKKQIVAVSKKGKIKAKKTGTSKISVTVKGKNGKKKTTWVKIKVVNKLPAQNPTTSKPSDPVVSRGEFVSDLMEALNMNTENECTDCPYTDISSSPYKSAIQNAWVNGFFIKETTSFSPENPCTKEFAAATAILAMGYVDEENISPACNDASSVDEKYRSLVAIAIDQKIVMLISGRFEPALNITKSAEKQLLSVISSLENRKPSAEEKVNIDYAENVYAVSEENVEISLWGDKQAEVVLPSEAAPQDLTQNGYLLAENSEDCTQSIAVKAEQIEQQGENTVVRGPVADDFTEMADSLQISGTADAANGIFIPEEGVTWDTGNSQTADLSSDISAQANKFVIGADGKISVKIDKKIGKDEKIEGSVSFKPTLDYDIDWKDGSFKKLYLVMNSELTTSVKAEISNELSIRLGTIPFPLPGTGMGCTVCIDLIIQCNGEVSIAASAEYQNGIEYNGYIKKINKCTKTGIDFSGCIACSVGPEVDAMITFFGCELADIGAEGGVKVSAKRTVRETGLVCEDASGSIYLSVFVGKRSPVMKKFGLIYTQKLIDDGKCIFKLGSKNVLKCSLHYEDGKKIKKCTYGTGAEDKPNPEPGPDPTPEPDPTPDPDEERKMPNNPKQPESAEDEWTGDYVYFGNNQKLRWKVLENDGENLLLMADANMGTRAYQDVKSLKGYDNTWEHSTLREFLNTEFLDLAFTKEEQEYLQINYVKNGVTEGQIDSGADTEDKVYLLSFMELKNTSWGFYSGNGETNSRKFKDSNNGGVWTRTLSHIIYGGAYAIWVDGNGVFQARGAWFTHPVTWSKFLYPVIKIPIDCPYWSMDEI